MRRIHCAALIIILIATTSCACSAPSPSDPSQKREATVSGSASDSDGSGIEASEVGEGSGEDAGTDGDGAIDETSKPTISNPTIKMISNRCFYSSRPADKTFRRQFDFLSDHDASITYSDGRVEMVSHRVIVSPDKRQVTVESAGPRSWGGTKTTTYLFNEHGSLVKYDEVEWADSNKLHISSRVKQEWMVDEFGCPKSSDKERYTSPSPDVISYRLSTRHIYEYNEAGLIVSESVTFLHDTNPEFVHSVRIEIDWNEMSVTHKDKSGKVIDNMGGLSRELSQRWEYNGFKYGGAISYRQASCHTTEKKLNCEYNLSASGEKYIAEDLQYFRIEGPKFFSGEVARSKGVRLGPSQTVEETETYQYDDNGNLTLSAYYQHGEDKMIKNEWIFDAAKELPMKRQRSVNDVVEYTKVYTYLNSP